MTRQMNDYVFYEDKQYVLIDCEKGTDMISSASFEVKDMPKVCTACYRGYMAEYYIEDDFLYGIKEIFELDGEGKEAALKSVKSSKHKLNYSGSIIIAKDNDGSIGSADNTFSYLYYDLAYELYFEDGMLLEINDLKDAIAEFQEAYAEIDKEEDYNEKIYRILNLERLVSKKYLKHEYANYKWSREPRVNV